MQKKIKIVVLVSIILIILGPIFGLLLDKVTLVDQSFVISDASNSDIRNATAVEFTLSKGQKIVIEFAAHTENVTAYLRIVDKVAYDEAYDDIVLVNPGSITGEDFIYSQFAYGVSPYSQEGAATSRTITYNGYWYIEFAGDVLSSGNQYLRSVPGDYVVVVYGTNSGGTNVYFDLSVKIDGPGEFVEILLILIGIGVLVAVMLLTATSYLKKTGRGLL